VKVVSFQIRGGRKERGREIGKKRRTEGWREGERERGREREKDRHKATQNMCTLVNN
jgi:hypothetical protein